MMNDDPLLCSPSCPESEWVFNSSFIIHRSSFPGARPDGHGCFPNSLKGKECPNEQTAVEPARHLLESGTQREHWRNDLPHRRSPVTRHGARLRRLHHSARFGRQTHTTCL